MYLSMTIRVLIVVALPYASSYEKKKKKKPHLREIKTFVKSNVSTEK